MPKRKQLVTSYAFAPVLLAVILLQFLSPVVEAKQKAVPDGSFFSSPDADSDVVPTFVQPGGKPINANHDPRLPTFGLVKQLPSLTKDQRKQVDDLQKDLTLRIGAVQEHIATLQQQLDTAKMHPGETILIGASSSNMTALPSADQVRSEIADLRKNIVNQQSAANQQLAQILDAKQLAQVDQMRHGELVISGKPITKEQQSPPPPPKSNPAQARNNNYQKRLLTSTVRRGLFSLIRFIR